MILSTKNNTLNYQKLLRFMWSKQFLDATVLQIMEKTSKEKTLLKNSNSALQSEPASVKTHYFNPFMKTFIKKKRYSTKTQLFPKKLKNLHQYEIKVGLYNCIREDSTGGLYSVSHGKIQFISNLIGATGACKEQFSEMIIDYDFIHGVVITPILEDTTVSYSDPWNYALPIILIRVIIFILQIFERNMKFEAASQEWHYILQPLIRAALVEPPRKLKERIIFACLLITGMTYVSFIFSSSTETMVQVERRVKIEDLNDLYQDKSIKLSFSDQDCLKMLVKHKDMSCFMRKTVAEALLANSSTIGAAQIVQEPMATAIGCIYMEPATPYVDRFNEIIALVVQSGLYGKWETAYSINASFKIQPNDSVRPELRRFSDSANHDYRLHSFVLGVSGRNDPCELGLVETNLE